MILTIRTKHQPATDLGYLLHKHPDRLQMIKLPMGQAHIFYPEATESATTVALLLEIDAIKLARSSRQLGSRGFALGQYVNDRPYVASSFMSSALSKAFSSAMNGSCKQRPELVDQAIPLEVSLSGLVAEKGGEQLIRQLFEPLGYEVELEQEILDVKFPNWGASPYFKLKLKHQLPLKDLLTQLYVLIPVLDNDKHYYVSEAEIKKLLEKGGEWLKKHPHKELIIKRYLFNIKSLITEALEELEVASPLKQERFNLHQARLEEVLARLKKMNVSSVLDLGCGEGKLLKLLLKEKQFQKIAGMDVSYKELLRAKDQLYWDEMAPRQKERIQLFQSALTYKDERLKGYEAAVLVEVIEHLDEERLEALELSVFDFVQAQYLIVTTPNASYNAKFKNLAQGEMRHDDHRFEWTRAEFEAWGNPLAEKYNYQVKYYSLGPIDAEFGAPSQMAIFSYEN